jgi:hypothetical protein
MSTISSMEMEADITIFNHILVNMFALKNPDNKMKKCYLELRNCFLKLGMHNEAFKIVEKCYEIFANDIVIMYEYLKQCIIVTFNLSLIFHVECKFL